MPSVKKFRILKFKSKPILTAKGISKIINNRVILRKIDFEINKGEIFGLLGPNGAGKSVTFNVLLGIMKSKLLRLIWGLITSFDSLFDSIFDTFCLRKGVQ